MNKNIHIFQKEIIDKYAKGYTLKALSEEYKCWPDSIGYLLKKSGVALRSKGKAKGAVPWNKGRMQTQQERVDLSKKLFETGEIHELAEQTIRSHAKRILIEQNGNCCSICNTNLWNNMPVPLVCDHIDGNPLNNNFTNFRLVCCNCDAQLPTFKSKNRGNGRRYDRERYHNTK